MKKSLLMAMCALAISATLFAAETPGKPGKWEQTIQTEIEGMPMKMPPVKTTVCITDEDMKNAEKSLPQAQADCKMIDYEVDGNTVTWKVKCTGEQPATGEGKVTYTDDAYTGTMKMEMEEMKMTMKMSGKWLGSCTKK